MKFSNIVRRHKKIIVIAAIGFAVYIASAFFLQQKPPINDERSKDKDLAKLLAATSSIVFFPIERVVDGDTLVVRVSSGLASIRLIGMNTPETVDKRKPIECFGPEASAHAHEVFDEKQVGLLADPAEGGLDISGRVLAYAYTSEGSLYNKDMIAAGYAYEYTFKAKYGHQKDFRAAQAAAKKAKLGLWSPATCNGQKKK